MSGATTNRPLLAAVRRAFRNMAAASSIGRWILVLLIIVTVLILIAPTRTIQLQARALSAEIEMAAEPLAWDLTRATVCIPTLDLMAEPIPPCGVGEAFESSLEGPVTWSRGQQLALDWTPAYLSIRLLSQGNGWPIGTTLRLERVDLTQNGALAFSGYLSLGQEMAAGATGYVLDGSYAIYEQGLVSSWLRWSPEVTRQGPIRRGDQVQILCIERMLRPCVGKAIENKKDQFRNPVAGSISVDHDGQAGMHLVATGAEANSVLEVAYSGRDSIIFIRPSWVQRAAASSSLLALSLLFSLIAPLLLPILNRNGNTH